MNGFTVLFVITFVEDNNLIIDWKAKKVLIYILTLILLHF